MYTVYLFPYINFLNLPVCAVLRRLSIIHWGSALFNLTEKNIRGALPVIDNNKSLTQTSNRGHNCSARTDHCYEIVGGEHLSVTHLLSVPIRQLDTCSRKWIMLPSSLWRETHPASRLPLSIPMSYRLLWTRSKWVLLLLTHTLQAAFNLLSESWCLPNNPEPWGQQSWHLVQTSLWLD